MTNHGHKEPIYCPCHGRYFSYCVKAGGRDIQIVGVYSQHPRLSWHRYLVEHGNELREKIAVPIGTEAHFLLTKILAEQGLTLRDVELVNLLIPDGITAPEQTSGCRHGCGACHV